MLPEPATCSEQCPTGCPRRCRSTGGSGCPGGRRSSASQCWVTTASSVLSSPAKPCFESPFVYRLILPIAPRMSSRWTLKSRGMEGFFEDRLAKSWLDRFPEDEVHRAPEQPL